MSEDSELPIRQSDRRDAIEQSNYISHQQEHNTTQQQQQQQLVIKRSKLS